MVDTYENLSGTHKERTQKSQDLSGNCDRRAVRKVADQENTRLILRERVHKVEETILQERVHKVDETIWLKLARGIRLEGEVSNVTWWLPAHTKKGPR